MCAWRGFARGSDGHLLNFPNQIYADLPCAGGVALLGAGAAFCAFRFSPGLNKESTQLDSLKTF